MIPIRFVPKEDHRADAGRFSRVLRTVHDGVAEELGESAHVGHVELDGFEVVGEAGMEDAITDAVARSLVHAFGDEGLAMLASGSIVADHEAADARELGL